MSNILNTLGLTVVAFRGHADKRRKSVPVDYILFSDGETYIELEEQDSSYHDCDKFARRIIVRKSKELWDIIMSNYSESNNVNF